MNVSSEREFAHARALRARGSALPAENPPAEILDSWARCMEAGLDLAAPLPVTVVEASDLARRQERAAVVRRLAQAELEGLARQIAGSNFLLAFADPEGVILDLYADNRFAMSGADAGIVAGSTWTEALCGTNGLGTALALGRAVAVTGPEHYLLRLGEVSCTAAPVHDARGDIVGVLDASSYFESRQRHTQALVQMAATHIENGLLLAQMRGQLVLAVHPRPEFLGTLSAGLLAFDEDGRVLALNARGRQLLQGLAAAPGTPFEALFGEPWEHVLARLARSSELRLRDTLGSTLSAVCMSPPGRPKGSYRSAQHEGTALSRPGQAGGDLQAPLRGPGARARRAIADRIPDRAAAADALRVARTPPPTQALVAEDPEVAEALRLSSASVRINVPVLILGETGSGKELLARHAHDSSGRRGEFVAVNCAAVPAELFEAELFGHVAGAYTGARREGSAGLIVSADGGTLLLDEVRELRPQQQAVLLRFLDDGLVRPVGGTATRRVDVQVLAATNASLDDEVAAHRFRADLLYRLNTVCVSLPPLRRRRDFAAAVRHVLAALDGSALIDDAAIERLQAHAWPGNFRELRAVLTRALLAGGDRRHLQRADVDALLPSLASASASPQSALQQGAGELVRREYERTGGSISRTSRNLGISRTTVYRHLAGRG